MKTTNEQTKKEETKYITINNASIRVAVCSVCGQYYIDGDDHDCRPIVNDWANGNIWLDDLRN
jgi:hypothetical protein